MRLLIDGDVVVYRTGFAAEKTCYDFYHASDVTVLEDGFDVKKGAEMLKSCGSAKEGKTWLATLEPTEAEHIVRVPRKVIEPVENALHSTKLTMQRIEDMAYDRFGRGIDVTVYFSCSTADNWRTLFYPEYKANRPDRKPFWAQDIKDYLFNHWTVLTHDHREADDLISMTAWGEIHNHNPVCIASIDKDFQQIPCFHLNWTTEEILDVDPLLAQRNLAVQRIMGDSVDNIKGIPKIGKARAEQYLQASQAETVDEAVLEAYVEHYGPELGAYHAAVNTALVTLPCDEDHIIDMMEAIQAAADAVPQTEDTPNEDA